MIAKDYEGMERIGKDWGIARLGRIWENFGLARIEGLGRIEKDWEVGKDWEILGWIVND